MRLIWNAGATLTVTGFLTVAASLLSGPAQLALAHPPPAATGGATVPLPSEGGAHRHYTGLAEHFRAANASDDDRLTLEQARQAGWVRVVRHFQDIDTGHKGFVTLAQVHAFNVAQRHAHHRS